MKRLIATILVTFLSACATYPLPDTEIDRAKAYNKRGSVYHIRGQYYRAISDYTKAIEINTEFAEAYNNRGAAHQSKGLYEKAMSETPMFGKTNSTRLSPITARPLR